MSGTGREETLAVVFIGTAGFAVPVLRRLVAEGCLLAAVVTQPDRPAGRGRLPVPPPVKATALELALPVWQPLSWRTRESVAYLRELKPEVIVLAAYGQILPPEVLAVPPRQCLNLHASLLPKLRGASPIATAILQGETETGVTLMVMDAGMDTGPILAQRRLIIDGHDTSASLEAKLGRLAADLLAEELPRWVKGELAPRPQDETQATYTRVLRKEDGRVDWTQPAEAIWRQCRAYFPWPGSFTFWGGKRLRLLEVEPSDTSSAGLAAGSVSLKPGRPAYLMVATGKGALVLYRLQLEGKGAVSAEEFVRGRADIVGATLGQAG